MSFDTMNQGISNQLSDIQQNIHRTYMTYEAKSKEKGVNDINGKLLNTKKLLEDKVKWGVTIVDKKTQEFIQKTMTTLDTKAQ